MSGCSTIRSHRNLKQRKVLFDNLEEANVYDKPIVTKLGPLEKFYVAESYHQDYVRHNPDQPYVVLNARAKVDTAGPKYAKQVREPMKPQTDQ